MYSGPHIIKPEDLDNFSENSLMLLLFKSMLEVNYGRFKSSKQIKSVKTFIFDIISFNLFANNKFLSFVADIINTFFKNITPIISVIS